MFYYKTEITLTPIANNKVFNGIILITSVVFYTKDYITFFYKENVSVIIL